MYNEWTFTLYGFWFIKRSAVFVIIISEPNRHTASKYDSLSISLDAKWTLKITFAILYVYIWYTYVHYLIYSVVVYNRRLANYQPSNSPRNVKIMGEVPTVSYIRVWQGGVSPQLYNIMLVYVPISFSTIWFYITKNIYLYMTYNLKWTRGGTAIKSTLGWIAVYAK